MLLSEHRARILLLLSLVLAGFAALRVYQQMQDVTEQLGGLVPIYVAATDIAAREPITKTMVMTISIPKRYVREEHVTDLSELEGNTSLIPLRKGEWISKSMLKPASFLDNARLRLVPVDASEKVYIDPYLKPFDRADLLISRKVDGGSPQTVIFRTDLEVADVTEGQENKPGKRVYISVPLELAPEILHVLHYSDYAYLLKASSLKPTAETLKTRGTSLVPPGNEREKQVDEKQE